MSVLDYIIFHEICGFVIEMLSSWTSYLFVRYSGKFKYLTWFAIKWSYNFRYDSPISMYLTIFFYRSFHCTCNVFKTFFFSQINSLIIPTAETARQEYFLSNCIAHNIPVMVMGPSGEKKNYQCLCWPFK